VLALGLARPGLARPAVGAFGDDFMVRTWDIDSRLPFIAVTAFAQTNDG